MQQKIFENKYVQIFILFINQQQSIYSYRWKKENKYMTPEAYKEEVVRHGNHILQYKPTFVLADFQESEFIISSDLQMFVKVQMFDKMIEAGTKKLAVIQPPDDDLLKMSIEQTVEEQTSAKYITKYFSSIDEAKIWFVKKDLWHAYARNMS